MNPMDEKGFGRNCDNSERHGIRCIGEDLIVMIPDALVRTCFKSVCTIQSISLQSDANMASGSGSDGGGGGDCRRLHRPGGDEFECVRKKEWEELVEEVVGVMSQLEGLEDVEEGSEWAKEAWVTEDVNDAMGRDHRAPPTVEGAGSPVERMTARLAILRRRLYDRVSRRITGDAGGNQ